MLKEHIKEINVNTNDKNYLQLLQQAKQKIISTRIQVARAASRTQFELYWWLGEQIVTAQNKHGWGKAVIEQLSTDSPPSHFPLPQTEAQSFLQYPP